MWELSGGGGGELSRVVVWEVVVVRGVVVPVKLLNLI